MQGIRKEYDDGTVALHDLDLTIDQGEFFGYLGPNGAGKTTTINILTGLCSYSNGTAEVMGHDATDDYQHARMAIGLSEQEINVDPYFTIKEALRYQAGFYGIGRKQAKQRALELLDQLGIADKADNRIRQLSGGMKRRVAIAKAMVHDPPILILDEPTAGLDVELRRELWEYMTKINEEQNKTILLTTHYIEEAEQLCNRIGILNNGELIALDDKDELMNDLSHKQLKVKTDATTIPDAIHDIDEDAELHDGELIIHLAPKSNPDKIIRVVQENVTIKDILIEREDLEEIFVRLINE
jgi:ABC-2 type transport system ATP-binding protein